MMTRRPISGKAGKHVTTIRTTRRRSPSRSPNRSPFQDALARARARARLRNAISKILSEIRMRPGTGSMYRAAERNFYRTAASVTKKRA